MGGGEGRILNLFAVAAEEVESTNYFGILGRGKAEGQVWGLTAPSEAQISAGLAPELF